MIRQVDTDEILTELQALAQDSTGPALVAILLCMDVVDRHAKIVDERELAERVGSRPSHEQPPLLVQHAVTEPEPEPEPEVDGWPCPFCSTVEQHLAEIDRYRAIANGGES